jgi:hypothetical protein
LSTTSWSHILLPKEVGLESRSYAYTGAIFVLETKAQQTPMCTHIHYSHQVSAYMAKAARPHYAYAELLIVDLMKMKQLRQAIDAKNRKNRKSKK